MSVEQAGHSAIRSSTLKARCALLGASPSRHDARVRANAQSAGANPRGVRSVSRERCRSLRAAARAAARASSNSLIAVFASARPSTTGT
jgi:hypothetical protein